jgi:adenine-specific DNA-methyltransferase
MNGYSQTPAEERINMLQSLIPEVFDEGGEDWIRLKAALSENAYFANGRCALNWASKSDASWVMQHLSSTMLIPCRKESVDFDTTLNIYIESENMETLKVLQKSYFEKINMSDINFLYDTKDYQLRISTHDRSLKHQTI